MLPLCKELGITVNELLSGEMLSASDYKLKAEENIMKLMSGKQENKKKIILEFIVVLISLISAITLIEVAGLVALANGIRVLLIVIALIVLVLGIGVACVMEQSAGYYECSHCGHRFVPDMKTFVMALHTPTRRRLKCPECGKKSYCKKRLSKDDE